MSKLLKKESILDVQIPFDIDLPIVITKIWKLILMLKVTMLTQPTDKYTFCVSKYARVVGQLKKGCNGRFAKTVFYF